MAVGFFQNFQKIIADLSGESPGKPKIVTNILTRVAFLRMIKDNNLLWYPYTVKDSDTPWIVADKYYGNSERYWIVLLANDMVDPFYDWPLSYDRFNAYITKKYGSIGAAQQKITQYTKTTVKHDSNSGTSTTWSQELDVTTYNSLPASLVESINLSNGTTVAITITTKAISAYDQEFQQNEDKRIIKILDAVYTQQIEKELKTLVSS